MFPVALSLHRNLQTSQDTEKFISPLIGERGRETRSLGASVLV